MKKKIKNAYIREQDPFKFLLTCGSNKKITRLKTRTNFLI